MRSAAVQVFVSGMLLGLFCVPTIGPAVHALLENHEHTVCTAENEYHFHDAPDDCHVCNYLIGIKTFHKEDKEVISPVPAISSIDIPPQCESSFELEIPAGVRGPPVLA